MSTAYFVCGGNGLTHVGQEAERLHPGFEGLVECPQELLPELAGRRMFLIQFVEVEPADVEVIRQGLIQKLNTRAWSLTADAEGKTTIYPARTASDGLPRGVSLRDEEDLPPWHHEDPVNWDQEGFDDDGGDEAWDYPGPRFQSYGRRHSFGPEYGHGDRYDDDDGDEAWDYPGPRFQSHGRRHSFGPDYGHGDRYDDDDGDEAWDYPGPHFQSHGRRHSFGPGYGHGYEYDHIFGPHSHRGPRRNSFAMDYDVPYDFSPPPFHTRPSRTSRHPATYDQHGRYPRAFSPPRQHNRRSHTFPIPTAYEPRDNYVPPPRGPPYPWDRNHTPRSRGTHPPQHGRSSTNRHYGRDRGFVPPFTGYHSTRNAVRPTPRATHPSTSNQLSIRGRDRGRRGRGPLRKVWGMIRAFLAI